VRETSRNFLVGLTSIIALVGLAALLMLFGELEAFVEPRYAITINTDHAAGLRPGSSAAYNGVPIGVVDEISVQGSAADFPVRVVALIDQSVLLPSTAEPYVTSSLLGGASILEFQARIPDEGVDYLPRDGTAEISSPVKFALIEQITQELDKRFPSLAETVERFNAFITEYQALGENLNHLLAEQSEAAIEGGETPNLNSVVRKIYEVLDETDQAMRLAREWLGDEQLRGDVHAAVESTGTLIDQASLTLENVTALAEQLRSDTTEVKQRLLPVADEMAATLAEIRRVSHLAAEGEGTVGRLLNDPDLYNSLNDAALRLDQALRELRLFIEKAQSEGLPVQF
jgi:phospholipid/cholesterol/gamma-HCH transport system substrate-binding protein